MILAEILSALFASSRGMHTSPESEAAGSWTLEFNPGIFHPLFFLSNLYLFQNYDIINEIILFGRVVYELQKYSDNKFKYFT